MRDSSVESPPKSGQSRRVHGQAGRLAVECRTILRPLPAQRDPSVPIPSPSPAPRLAINGYGRIGRCFLRALHKSAQPHRLQRQKLYLIL